MLFIIMFASLFFVELATDKFKIFSFVKLWEQNRTEIKTIRGLGYYRVILAVISISL